MTDSDFIALAQRIVDYPKFRWLPGMREARGFIVVQADEVDGMPITWFCEGFAHLVSDENRGIDPAVPDLRDAATLGCLLQLVREAWQMDMFVIAVSRNGGRWEVWARGSDDGPFTWGETEAEALVAAMRAAPA